MTTDPRGTWLERVSLPCVALNWPLLYLVSCQHVIGEGVVEVHGPLGSIWSPGARRVRWQTSVEITFSSRLPLPCRLLLEKSASTGVVSFEMELPLDVAQGADMVALLKDWMQRQSVDDKAARGAEEQLMLQDANHWLQTGQYP